MSKELNFLEKAVYYSEENPLKLAKFLHSVVRPVEIEGDITSSISVANNTALETVKSTLGTKQTITVDGLPADVTVSWGADTEPTYQQGTAGKYVLDGDISGLPSNIKNTSGHKLKMTIIIAEAES